MKKYFILFVACVLPAAVYCQGKINVEKEKAAIITVIERQTNSTYRIGFDSWAEILEALESVFVQDSIIVIWGGKNGYGHSKGKYNVDPVVKDSLINVAPPPEPASNRHLYTNYQIKVYPESAWAVYDEDIYSDEGEYLRHFDCVRFLEKVDGEWKINYMSYFNTTSYEVAEEETE